MSRTEELTFSLIKSAAAADDVIVGIRGSSVTGFSRSAESFTSTPKDYDFFIVSNSLYQEGLAAGAKDFAGSLRVSATMKFFPRLTAIENKLSDSFGKKSTIRIFSASGFSKVQNGSEILSK